MAFVRIFKFGNFAGSGLYLKLKTSCVIKFFDLKFCTRVMYSSNTAYLQHIEENEQVQITLNFNQLSINKILTFDRSIFEKLDEFLKRLELKLETYYTKKNKKKNKNKGEFGESNPIFNAFVLLNNQRITDDIILKDILENKYQGNLKLRILDCDYDVVVNSPIIQNVTLPNHIRVGNFIHPETFKARSTDISQSKFEWFKSKKPQKLKNWIKCGEGYFYEVKEDDLNYFLKLVCLPILNEKVGPLFEVQSKHEVQNYGSFDEILKRHEYTKESTGLDEFRIVSYNILADVYVFTKEARTSLFTFCDPECLKYEFRKGLLNTELKGYNSDIICLQEVDRKFYKNSICILFSEWGYGCVYYEKEGSREGCALLYNKQKFNLLQANQYTFTKEILNNPLLNDIKLKVQENTKLMERLKPIQSLIQVVVLESESNGILVIGNTHFYFHPEADHIRLLQGILSLRILLNTVENFKQKEPNKRISVLLCGDLNSTPDCGFHQLLNEGLVDSNHIDWRSKEDETILHISYSHSLKLRSAYDNTKFTNYTPSFKACLDYIYFQYDHLELKKTVPIPSEEVLSKNAGIPSKFFPSDHVALIAEFKFKKN